MEINFLFCFVSEADSVTITFEFFLITFSMYFSRNCCCTLVTEDWRRFEMASPLEQRRDSRGECGKFFDHSEKV